MVLLLISRNSIISVNWSIKFPAQNLFSLSIPLLAPHLFSWKRSILREMKFSGIDLYLYHSRPGALERLLPPWEKTTIISKQGTISPGSRVKLKMYAGPFPFHFHAHHIEDQPGKMFRDIQEKGPFSSWSHTHYFQNTEKGSLLEDRIEYTLPGHRYLPSFVTNHIKKKLTSIFQQRQRTLSADITLHQRCSQTPLKILITGASGVLGKALIPLLTTGGHTVWTLVRRHPDPERNEIDQQR